MVYKTRHPKRAANTMTDSKEFRVRLKSHIFKKIVSVNKSIECAGLFCNIVSCA